jgi:hypothetical protein
MPAQDPPDRRGRHPDQGGQRERADPMPATRSNDAALDPRRGAQRAAPWPARPVEQTGLAFRLEPCPPLRHRLPGHPELLGHPGLRPASLDATHQQLAGMNSQSSVSVLHEDLPVE